MRYVEVNTSSQASRKSVIYLALAGVFILFSSGSLLRYFLKSRQRPTIPATTDSSVQPITSPDTTLRQLECEIPSIRFGLRRLISQYSTSLPQVQLTLISILQGLAFGVLLLNDSAFPNQFFWGVVVQFSLRQHLYLPFVSSSLIILLVWMDFAYASLILIWPASFFQAGLIYFIGFVEILTFKEINSLPIWFMGTGFIAMVGGSIRYNNFRIHNEEDFEDAQVSDFILRGERGIGLFEIGLGLASVLAACLYLWFIPILPANAQQIIQWAMLIDVSIVVMALLGWDSYRARQILGMIVKDSEFVTTKHLGIRYRKISTEQ